MEIWLFSKQACNMHTTDKIRQFYAVFEKCFGPVANSFWPGQFERIK